MRRERVLILGGGYVGLYAAQTLRRKARRRVDITVVDQRPYMTYQPFLPETAAGSIEPRHAVVPLRSTLRGIRVVQATVKDLNHQERRVHVVSDVGDDYYLEYDQVIVALGAISRTLPIPGLREFGMGFKHIEEAIYVRNVILGRLSRAASTSNPELRKRLLTFVFVGGGFAGVEACAESEDMAREALRYHPELSADDLNFVMVEAAGRILPEVGPDLGAYALAELRRRGIDVFLETRLESCVDGHVVLSDSQEFDASTVVWTAGVKPHPVIRQSDLPLADSGHVLTLTTLQVHDGTGTVVPGAWSAGDCAQVPDYYTTAGPYCAPSAQHAVRQARHLGKNMARHLRGRRLREYRHRHLGLVASLGLHQGVAWILGIKLRGWLAWFVHRTYHMSQIPSVNRKTRVILDWTAATWFRRDMVSMGRLHDPHRAFDEAASS